MSKILYTTITIVLITIFFSSCKNFFEEKYKATKEDCLKIKANSYNGLYEIDSKGKFFGVDGYDSIIVAKEPLISFKKIINIKKSYDELGRPLPVVELNEEASKIFESYTEKNVGKKLAIIVNDELQMAPVIHSKISGGSLQVAANRDEKEVDRIVRNIAIISQCSKKK